MRQFLMNRGCTPPQVAIIDFSTVDERPAADPAANPAADPAVDGLEGATGYGMDLPPRWSPSVASARRAIAQVLHSLLRVELCTSLH